MGRLDDQGDSAQTHHCPADAVGRRTSCGEGLCMRLASYRFPIYLSTRRVILPVCCCYRDHLRSGDLRQFAYEFRVLAQDTDQDGGLVIGL